MARERVACLLRIPETFHMPASSVHAESGPETSQSPARSILARRRLPRSLHQRIRTHAHGGLIVGLFVEQQDLSARFHIMWPPNASAVSPVLSSERNEIPTLRRTAPNEDPVLVPPGETVIAGVEAEEKTREAMEFMLASPVHGRDGDDC